MAEDGELHEFEVRVSAAGKRLDQFLGVRLHQRSRSYLQRLIDEGRAKVDGQLGKRAQRLRPGEIVELFVPAPVAADIEAQDIPLAVVFEDEHLLVIDKPAGLVVHPNDHDRDGTLVNALLQHCGDSLSGINGVERPGIVHRIDKDTTGLLVVAKHDRAHQGLADQFREHSTERLYVALVYGGAPMPREGTITTHIGRDPRDRKRMASVQSGGKHAITHFKVAEDYGAIAMVECALDTGRTHQIRVHMAELGHPLVADPVYGGLKKKLIPAHAPIFNALDPLRGQMLHAATLGFIHPVTDEYKTFRCPPHPAMAQAITTLRAFAGLVDPEDPWARTTPISFGRTNALAPDRDAESY